MNRVIRGLVFVTFGHNMAIDMIAPIFAVFVTQQVSGSLTVIGLATSSFWLSKSFAQLHFARKLDRAEKPSEDFWALTAGYLVSSLALLGYLAASHPIHLYLIHAVRGLAMAWAVPAWFRLFTSHLDKWGVGFEWSLESVFSVGLAATLASAAGGILADQYGFQTVIALASGIGTASALAMIWFKEDLLPGSSTRTTILTEHGPHH